MIFRPLPFILLLAGTVALPALAPAQKLVMWGRNDNGQSTNEFDSIVSAVVGGGLFSVMLFPSGAVYAWGNNDFGQTTYPLSLRATHIDAGGNHTIAVRTDGTVTGWGFGQQGQLSIPAGLVATRVSAGGNHSMALRADGSVACWGENIYGECNVPAGLVASQISAGTSHSIALRTNGTVALWGATFNGLGNYPIDMTAKSVAAGGYHCLAVRSDDTVFAWGRNLEGQANVPSGLTATQVAAGSYHSLALRPDGTVAAWGQNTDGQCNVPAGLSGVVDIAAGNFHSMALVAAIYCTLDQSEVLAGDAATGTIRPSHLRSDSYSVGLVSTDSRVHVPSTVVFEPTSLTKTFPVTTDVFVGPDVEAKVYTVNLAAAEGSTARKTVAARIKVKGAKVTAAFASAATGGTTTRPKLNVSLSMAATNDVVLGIVNPSPGLVTLPATVTIPAGQKTATVSVLGTSRVSSSQSVTVGLQSAGIPVGTANLTINPIRANVTFTTPILTGGEAGKGAIYLSAAVAQPLAVALSSADPSVSVPWSVTVAAGARLATFPIATSAVGVNLTVPIRATILGNPVSANLRVLAIPVVKSLTLPASVFGNGRVTGTVRLNISGRAGGTAVALSSSDQSLTVPATVTVPEGQYAATFVATASDVASVATATVTASTPLGSASAGVAVNPLSVSSLTLSSATAPSGSTVNVAVTLNTAVAVDTPVALTSTDSALVPVPATVTIPAGSKTATISVTLGSAAAAKNVRIAASKHGSSQYRTLKVTP